MLIFSRVCAVQKLKIHLFAYYSNATKRYQVQNMSNTSELRQAVIASGTSEIHRDCGITVQSSGK